MFKLAAPCSRRRASRATVAPSAWRRWQHGRTAPPVHRGPSGLPLTLLLPASPHTSVAPHGLPITSLRPRSATQPRVSSVRLGARGVVGARGRRSPTFAPRNWEDTFWRAAVTADGVVWSAVGLLPPARAWLHGGAGDQRLINGRLRRRRSRLLGGRRVEGIRGSPVTGSSGATAAVPTGSHSRLGWPVPAPAPRATPARRSNCGGSEGDSTQSAPRRSPDPLSLSRAGARHSSLPPMPRMTAVPLCNAGDRLVSSALLPRPEAVVDATLAARASAGNGRWASSVASHLLTPAPVCSEARAGARPPRSDVHVTVLR